MIDDDTHIRRAWELRALVKDKKILTFESALAFEQIMAQLDLNTPIYIDSDLGKQSDPGETYAKILFEKGFTNLYMSSGHDAAQFKELPWLKGVVKKMPPF